MSMRALFSIALLQVALFASTTAFASPDFPPFIQQKLLLSYTPGCTLCHTDAGTNGAVTTDFGASVVAFGAQPDDTTLLGRVLDAMRARRWDSDGDGVSDIDELLRATDPNGPALSQVAGPEYGCALRAAPARAPLHWVVFASMIALFALATRKRPSFCTASTRDARGEDAKT